MSACIRHAEQAVAARPGFLSADSWITLGGDAVQGCCSAEHIAVISGRNADVYVLYVDIVNQLIDCTGGFGFGLNDVNHVVKRMYIV